VDLRFSGVFIKDPVAVTPLFEPAQEHKQKSQATKPVSTTPLPVWAEFIYSQSIHRGK